MGKPLGLYVHIPFCKRKCHYCDFLSFPAEAGTMKQYIGRLIREIKEAGEYLREREVDTVFFGGGTPSLLSADLLSDLFSAIMSSFSLTADAEITIEVNPGTLTEEILPVLSRYVNRVSVGIQSASDRELKLLGRIHTIDEGEETIRRLQQAGIRNINVDLMSGIPKQDLRSWKQTLAWVLDRKVQHVSAYSLIVEEGTPFDRMESEGTLLLPDEETERKMYYETNYMLQEGGFHRYEISNYSLEGFECRHNLRYWERREYLGFGIGASSFLSNTRWSNTGNLNAYLTKGGRYRSLEDLFRDPIHENREELTLQAQMEEFMFLGLRMMKGISEQGFFRSFHCSLESVYRDVLQDLIGKQLLVRTTDGYRLTEQGIDVSNLVLSEFLLG